MAKNAKAEFEDEESDCQEIMGLFQCLGDPLSSLTETIARYSHCEVCGGFLHLTHCTDFNRNLTQETAKCPECGLRARKLVHPLQ